MPLSKSPATSSMASVAVKGPRPWPASHNQSVGYFKLFINQSITKFSVVVGVWKEMLRFVPP